MLTVPAPPTITLTPWSIESLGSTVLASAPASTVWPASNRAMFIPFRLATPIIVVKLFVLNGATVSGNVDLGIYDEAGTRLVSSGSTTQAGTSVIQTFDITDTELGIGLFFLALAVDNTTATIYRRGVNAQQMRANRCYQMASAFALPATATFAAVASAYVPLIGLSTDTVI